MRVHKFECGRGAIRALDLVIALDQLTDIVIDTRLTEAFSALVALSRINHDVLAKDTVEEGVVLSLLRGLPFKTLSCINLGRCQCHSPFHD